MVLKMKTDYFSPNNNNPNNNSNNIIIRPISMNIVDGDVEHVIDVNYLKRGSCEHRDSILSTSTSSSCRKVEEEEFEIQQQHNKKQALECECNNTIIIIKNDDDDGNDDDTSTCIDTTTTTTTTSTSTSTSTTTSPRVVVVPITKKTKNNKVVRFTSECENVMYRYPRPTREEKLDMYMSRDDYERIIMNVVEGIHNKQESNNDDNNNSEDIDTNNDNNNENENELCIECILVQQNSDRIERVKSAVSTILKRQKQQKYQKQMMTTMNMNMNMNMNIIDDDDNDNDNRHIDDNDYESWLEKYYRQPYSKLSLKLAGNRGLRDQEVILSSLSPRKIVMTR